MESQGWEVERKRKYYRARCPCGEHSKMIAMTPSGRHYENHWRQWLVNQTCWKVEEEP
jgi:hypothetical protein